MNFIKKNKIYFNYYLSNCLFFYRNSNKNQKYLLSLLLIFSFLPAFFIPSFFIKKLKNDFFVVQERKKHLSDLKTKHAIFSSWRLPKSYFFWKKKQQASEQAWKEETRRYQAWTDACLPSYQLEHLIRSILKQENLVLTHFETIKMIQDKDPERGLNSSHLFFQNVSMTWQGHFESSYNYIRQLEQLPWHFIIRSIHYQVMSYPIAQIQLNMEVLTHDEKDQWKKS